MGVAKLSASKKAILFIDDEGVVYMTSVAYMQNMINGTSPQPLIALTRFPNQVAKTRFSVSKVLGDEPLTQRNDAFEAYNQSKKEVKDVIIEDKMIW